jgi:class 3 adenylate cyclase
MKLRTKLLIGVAIVLVSFAILTYFLPHYFVKYDVDKSTEQIDELLEAEQLRLLRSQKIWLQQVLAHMKNNIDAMLLLINQEPELKARLRFQDQERALWGTLAELIGYDPEIGFIQLHDLAAGRVAAIDSHRPAFYFAKKEGEQLTLALGEEKQAHYSAFPIEQAGQEGHFFLLFDPDLPFSQEQIQKEIAAIPHAAIGALPSLVEPSASLLWATKIKMIRLLTPYYASPIVIDETRLFVRGIFKLEREGEGYLLLADEIFYREPFFNDQLYFEAHPGAFPLANGMKTGVLHTGDHAYISNTLALDEALLLTLGNSLDILIQQLSLATRSFMLLKIEEHYWVGFDARGHKLSRQEIDTILHSADLSKNQGIATVGQRRYLFYRIGEQTLSLYNFVPYEKWGTIFHILDNLQERLASRVSLHLSLLALAALVVILLWVARIGTHVFTPVRKLALATEDIVAGNYGGVKLPNVGKRKDEVAMLTHSFESMVIGLQEKEKIRAVLNKVVSKDIADEILHHPIQLGGEDREVSILFADIRGFTAMTKSLSPQETIQLLNQCMTKITKVIEGEGGIIDKFVGDEVMAIYGAPTTHPEHALKAIASGLLINQVLKKWNEERRARGEEPVEMGIGIHTGLVVAGNMGAEDRLNYTVLGSNVNLAARLCSHAKGNELLITERTLEEPLVASSFITKRIGPVMLKDFPEPISIYSVEGFKWETE